jgi:mono/diheme cytochrome c family protein
MRFVATAAAPLALAAALAGCGGGSGVSGRPGTAGSDGMGGGQGAMRSGSPMGAPTTTAAPPGDSGRSLFLASGCGGCHVLAAAGSTGTAGPNLDETRPGYTLVVRRVTEGGGSMPAFAGSLGDAQIRAIARFVADSAG